MQILLQLGLIALFLFLQPDLTYQAYFAGLCLCTVGIPHGANDFLYRSDKSAMGLFRFVILYVGIMGVYLGLWFLFPVAALVFFLIFSIHHFGQSNFEHPSWHYAPAVFLGAWVLFFPILLHSDVSIEILETMIHQKISVSPLFLEIGYYKIYALAGSGIFYGWLLYKYERQNTLKYLFQWLLLSVWFYCTPLLFGFICYFCLWHALQSLQHQWGYFKRSTAGSSTKFFVSLLPFGAMALLFLAVCIYFRGFKISEAFILLSLISLPHVAIMHRLYGVTAK